MQLQLKQELEQIFLLQQQCLKKSPINNLETCLNAWQELIESLTEHDFLGLADAISFYTELLECYCQQYSIVNAEQFSFLQHWQTLLESLFNSDSKVAVNAILNYLQNPLWLEAIEAEDCEFLVELLNADCLKLNSSIVNSELEDSFQVASNTCVNDEEDTDLSFEEMLQTTESIYIEEDTEQSFESFLQQTENTSIEDEIEAETDFANNLQDVEFEKELEESFKNESLIENKFDDEINFCAIDSDLLENAKVSVEPELTAMVGGQIGLIAEKWRQVDVVDQENLSQVIQKTLDTIEPIIKATEMLNLWGINQLLIGFEKNLLVHQSDIESLDESCFGLIETALLLMGLYFKNIGEKTHYQTLIETFCNLEWAYSLTEEEESYLLTLFESATVEDVSKVVREIAKPEDLLLDIPNDVDTDLLQMMYDELPVLSEQFSELLQQIIEEEQLQSLAEARRIAHTLKGLANMVGVKGVANLTHALENILELLAEQQQLPDEALSELLLDAADCIDGMNESLNKKTKAPENSFTILQQLFDAYYQLLTSEPIPEDETTALEIKIQAPDEKDATTEETAAKSLSTVKKATDLEIKEEKTSSTELTEEKESEETFVRVSKSTLDNLLRIAAEGSTLNAQLNEQMSQTKAMMKNSRERYRNKQKIISELEQHLQQQFDISTSLNQVGEDFDPLEMDKYNSIHSSISRLYEVIADTREIELMLEERVRKFDDLLATQSLLQKEDLQQILHTRLLPVNSLTSRFQRILRQACRATSKKARLEIEGDDLLVDGQILQKLADPLMHIIRNAVDHGLESAHQRFEKEKPEVGTIKLSFETKGESIVISCEDDGQGLNHQAIYDSAIKKGLIDENTVMSGNELSRLILIPGFSTKDKTSQLSGRGIGMDVVYQQIIGLKGRLDIQSSEGKGCIFKMTMPSSSLMLKALLIQCNKQLLSLASYSIAQNVLSIDGQIFYDAEKGLSFQYQQQTYSATSIEALTSQSSIDYLAKGLLFPVLIINIGEGEKVAIFVSKILAHREIVFKEMGCYVPPLPGITGLTILSSGQVSPVIDLPQLIREQKGKHQYLKHSTHSLTDYHLPRILVVDDSLSARKSTETLLKDSGYDVETAIDGVEALNKIQKQKPDLVITDLEMPRMTGIELASVIKSRKNISDMPIIMITSRSTDKHRIEAETAGVNSYLTKPWQETKLLDEIEQLLNANEETLKELEKTS